MSDPETLAIYTAEARVYGDRFDPAAPPSALAAFIGRLPAGGRAIDLGCGTGWAAAFMVRAGLEVLAIDAAPGMAAEARRRYGLGVEVARFDRIADEVEASADGVWAHFSLLHAPRAAMPGHLAAIARVLKRGGTLVLALKLGAGEARDRIGRRYTYYGDAELGALLANAGLQIRSRETGVSRGFDGTEGPWIRLFADA